MRMTVAEIAALVGGEVRGNGAIVIEGVSGLAEAGPSDLSFLSNPKYRVLLKETKAAAVLVSPDIPVDGRTAVVLKNPSVGWARVLEVVQAERARAPEGIHPSAVIAPGARLGERVAVGPQAVIEEGAVIGEGTVIGALSYIGRDVTVGADCYFHPRVTVRERVAIGARCIFQPGVVIGGDGYGFTFHEGRHLKIPQVGTVAIGDDVEIQANVTVDRAAVGVTRIGSGTKIDNLAQIAHGVEIGEHCLVVAQAGVAGSTRLGNYVTLAAQTGVAGHLTIGDGAIVAAQSGVSHDVKPKEVVFGSPAQPIRDEMKCQAALRQLPKLLEEWKALKKTRGEKA